MIPAYYHENGGIVMGNMRGLGNATPLRLVSPAPVLVNPGSAGMQMTTEIEYLFTLCA